ncbi:AER195Cp [Eremothecium gossypii ATCC 10895]|uniref:non-specific serine/threonine protein kinase n=1 Tax=Eremothecium gossypii (strain ATCC 10895 / CBS 109.51 / FGSC 9923 / NRRL Y-1056) TaxID=284811 RepID=Q756Q9_EREGS|nr:AER195Cp [Eremothecium gossypii ATCC 10895]AAS52876.1 AER195Cp [Eremothecium gossypii ATCC 10895]AEY97183.1 FAER195Cp [Eremothecium gossypii FDAG1]
MGTSSAVLAPQAQRPRKNTLSSKLGKLFGGPRGARDVGSSPVTLCGTPSPAASGASMGAPTRPLSPPSSAGARDDGQSVRSAGSRGSEGTRESGGSGRTSPAASRASPTAAAQASGRFVVHEDGTHEHSLKNAKRQEKLSSMIRNMLGAQKLRGEAKSAVPEILLGAKKPGAAEGDLPTLFSGLFSQTAQDSDGLRTPHRPTPDPDAPAAGKDYLSFAEKYGRCQEVIGKGAFGVVRICHKKDANGTEALYAVKEFKKRPSEDQEKYSRRLTSEFCLSSSLKHTNIINTLDLFQDAKGDYCEVMEYCSGGDLFSLIVTAGKLEYMEADCFFKQMIRGVVYMHDMGVCHRDLKPENLILTANGVLKITDFGNGECFRMAWEKDIHLSGGVCGSSPYIAPEEYSMEEFDPRPVDIWACGTIYMAMRTGRQLWRTAQKEDEFYARYLRGRKDEAGYEPIEQLKRARCRNVIYSILDPVPSRRINGKQILNSEWGREIKCCVDSHPLH